MKARPAKIGLYQPYPHTLGGLQAVVIQLAKGLPAAGYEPVMIVPERGMFSAAVEKQGLPFFVSDPGPAWHVYGRGSRSCTYLFSPRRVVALWRYWRKLASDLKQHQVSLLHCNDYRGVMLAAPAARLARIPVIWHMHGFIASRVANLGAAALVQCTVPVSRGMLDYLPLPAWVLGKLEVIYNGLEIDAAPTADAASASPDKPVVLAVGTLHPRKGYETLLHAFKRVAARVPTAECWIVGGEFGDGSYGHGLRELARSLGLDRHVKFLGYSNDVRNYMQRCSILTVPSRIEAFGMVAIEAMLLGKPVVASRTGGLKEIVAHRETGSLVAPENAGEMAIAIIELLQNQTLARAMGRAGRRRVEEKFTLSQTIESFATFYRSLLQPAT